MNAAFGALVLVLSTGVGKGVAADAPPTLAQKSVRQAEEAVEISPDNVEAYNRLARAWLRRAAEVDRPECYVKAESAARQASALNPKSLSARRIQIQALLGQERFETALELAQALNRENPDDIEVYGFIVDASIALGLYQQGEAAAQWMLDLRPDRWEGYARAAKLREVFGDLEGAADYLNRAFLGMPPDQPEARGLALADLARTLRLQGQLEEADRVLGQSLRLLPENPAVLLEAALLRRQQGGAEEAIALLRKRIDASPGAERQYRWAEALRRAGRSDEAEQAFREFETMATSLRELPANANRLLTLYWAENPSRAADALELAESELARRRDIQTRDAWAWALHANRRHDEALKEIEAVLAVGTRDPGIAAHAAEIRAAAP